MTLEEAIVYQIEDLLPQLTGRIYPVTIEQEGSLPAVAYKRISTRRDPALIGQGGYYVAMQFDITAENYTSMRITREDVRLCFENAYGRFTVDAPFIQLVDVLNEMDGFDTGTNLSLGILELEFYYSD